MSVEQLANQDAADQVLGPIIISALLFFAVLANFVIRGNVPYSFSSQWGGSSDAGCAPCTFHLIQFESCELFLLLQIHHIGTDPFHVSQSKKIPIPGMGFLSKL